KVIVSDQPNGCRFRNPRSSLGGAEDRETRFFATHFAGENDGPKPACKADGDKDFPQAAVPVAEDPCGDAGTVEQVEGGRDIVVDLPAIATKEVNENFTVEFVAPGERLAAGLAEALLNENRPKLPGLLGSGPIGRFPLGLAPSGNTAPRMTESRIHGGGVKHK